MGSASGGSAGQGASGGSIASIGLQTYATLLKAQGQATADTYQADRLDKAAQYGDLKADQTGAIMTRNLNTVLGNIDAVRAAAHTDPTSPTGAAVRDNQEMIGTEQRNISVNNIRAQAIQSRSDAAFYRQASSDALLSGEVSAGANAYSSLEKSFASGGGG